MSKVLWTEQGIRELLMHKLSEFGNNEKWCQHHKTSRGHLYDFLNGKRAASKSLLAALGFDKELRYVRNMRQMKDADF